MPERRTYGATHMGGEGSNWIGQSPFIELPHIFQNLGDGTYFHSGLLSIRACVAADVNITFKLLVNGAVAMTGGQTIEGGSIHGEITTPEIVRQLLAEGVKQVVVVSNEPDKYARGSFPAGVEVHHRENIDPVQRNLRDQQGVTALVYDQTCAAEARRLRRRGEFPEPDRRIVINEMVCEGCGDCSVQSNCISIEPVETEFGRKRKINQSSCNKDFSCVNGYCPSFVSVIGGKLRKTTGATLVADAALIDGLPLPTPPKLEEPWNVLVTGIGGTGVVTVGALLSMAAHLEGKGASGLDVTGLAQKNGAVTSHVRIARNPDAIHATRIGAGAADLLIGCDIVVATGPDALSKLSAAGTTAVVNSHVAPTADFATDPDLDFSADAMEATLRDSVGESNAHFVSASGLAAALMGDAIYTNPFLLGMAFQLGKLPVSLGALHRAIELNGRAIEANKQAFAWGRLAAHDLDAVNRAARPAQRASAVDTGPESLDALIERRSEFLVGYQNERTAQKYRALVQRVRQREAALDDADDALALAVARNYAKLIAYKDEYEVSRLFCDGSFRAQLEAEFEGDYKLVWHAAPPRLPVLDWFLPNRKNPSTGRTKKMSLGSWAFTLHKLLAKLKFLRGTSFDPFGRTPHRRIERKLIGDYEIVVTELLDGLTSENRHLAIEIANMPEHVRGFEMVKESQLETALEKQAQQLAAFRRLAAS